MGWVVLESGPDLSTTTGPRLLNFPFIQYLFPDRALSPAPVLCELVTERVEQDRGTLTGTAELWMTL